MVNKNNWLIWLIAIIAVVALVLAILAFTRASMTGGAFWFFGKKSTTTTQRSGIQLIDPAKAVPGKITKDLGYTKEELITKLEAVSSDVEFNDLLVYGIEKGFFTIESQQSCSDDKPGPPMPNAPKDHWKIVGNTASYCYCFSLWGGSCKWVQGWFGQGKVCSDWGNICGGSNYADC